MKKDIFISYSSRDEAKVLQVLEVFRQRNLSFWFGPEQLIAKRHDEEIVPAIKFCKIFMIFLSKHSRPRDGFQASDWVRNELNTAMEYKRFLLPIKLDGTVDEETNNLTFKGLPNYFDLDFEDFGSRVVFLADFVGEILDNYETKENIVLNFFNSKSKSIIKEIESSLENGFIQKASDMVEKNSFLLDYDHELVLLIKTIILMSKKPIKDMHMKEIGQIVENLHSLRGTRHENTSCYLEAMIAYSYFEFNAIANNLTDSYKNLKIYSKNKPRILSKFFKMTKNIKNTIPGIEFELRWMS